MQGLALDPANPFVVRIQEVGAMVFWEYFRC